MTTDELRARAMGQLQGAGALALAFVGVANGLFEALAEAGTPAEIAARAGVDAGYVTRWCDAAYAAEYLDAEGEVFRLAPLGTLYRRDTPGSLFPAAVQAVLGAHMMERAAGLMRSGERPGEVVLTERATVLPLFGPMLEASFGGLFARELLPKLEVFAEVDAKGGLVVDLGCGNGWYLGALAARFPRLRGIGLDGFGENVRQAEARAKERGVEERLRFREGDITTFAPDEPVHAVAMSRALHHVWHDADGVFRKIHAMLAPGGAAVIWEPAWPASREALREPRRRAMAFQNLSEHVQGNHFLRPDEIEAAFAKVGMRAETHLFAEGTEAFVVGRRDG